MPKGSTKSSKESPCYIEWLDHCSDDGRWKNRDAALREALVCKSVGFIVREDKKSITLALNTNLHHVSDCMLIIKSCILKKKILKV